MIQISLKDFLTTGKLGPVELGMRRQHLLDRFGKPDTMSYPPPKSRTPGIWKYGDVEFHFASGRAREGIALIHLDHFKTPAAGKRIHLDPWVLRGALSQAKVIKALDDEEIPHDAPSRMPRLGTTLVKMTSGVELIFNDDGGKFMPPIGLYAISLH